MKNLFLIMIASLVLIHCGDSIKKKNQKENRPLPEISSSYKGLVFASVNTTFQSSKVYRIDFESNELSPPFLTGQKGDPWLKAVGEELYFFNRKGNFNFSTLKFGEKIHISSQTRSPCYKPGAVDTRDIGDPHDILELKNGNMLLACWAIGTIIEFDPKNEKVLREITFNESDNFNPESFLKVEDKILVLHHGQKKDWSADGSQRLYVLEDDGRKVKKSDLDPIILRSSFPHFVHATKDRVDIIGTCHEYTIGCTQAIESYDFKQHRVELLDNLAGFDFSTLSRSHDGFRYRSVILSAIDKNSQSTHVISLDYEKGVFQTERLFDFYKDPDGDTTKDAGGYHLLIVDKDESTIFVGQNLPNEKGELVILRQGEQEKRVGMDLIPYSGAFLK